MRNHKKWRALWGAGAALVVLPLLLASGSRLLKHEEMERVRGAGDCCGVQGCGWYTEQGCQCGSCSCGCTKTPCCHCGGLKTCGGGGCPCSPTCQYRPCTQSPPCGGKGCKGEGGCTNETPGCDCDNLCKANPNQCAGRRTCGCGTIASACPTTACLLYCSTKGDSCPQQGCIPVNCSTKCNTSWAQWAVCNSQCQASCPGNGTWTCGCDKNWLGNDTCSAHGSHRECHNTGGHWKCNQTFCGLRPPAGDVPPCKQMADGVCCGNWCCPLACDQSGKVYSGCQCAYPGASGVCESERHCRCGPCWCGSVSGVCDCAPSCNKCATVSGVKCPHCENRRGRFCGDGLLTACRGAGVS